MNLKIQVTSNNSCLHERNYIFDVVFKEFLGLSWVHEKSEESGVTIRLIGYDGEIRLQDIFFIINEENWLTKESVPKTPLRTWDADEFSVDIPLVDKELPLICGDYQEKKSFTSKHIELPFDLFGSAFFMLSRYEEATGQVVDMHDRFTAAGSLSHEAGFLNRPIVDEYVNVLWAAMKHLWPNLSRKQRKPNIRVSCDVDTPFDLSVNTVRKLFRRIGGDLLKRRDCSLAIDTLSYARRLRRDGLIADRMWRFDWMMDVCEKSDVQCAFYFITDMRHPMDGDCYWGKPEIDKLIRRIYERGHEIGLHASYTTFDDPVQTKREFNRLIEKCDEVGVKQDNWGGRQHYLRWKGGVTWRNWSQAGLDYDSTLTYAESPGFRCGTCHPYPVYDLEQRKPLKLIEKPLIVMEQSVLSKRYQGMRNESALEVMLKFKGLCKKFNGEYTLLWHNSSLNKESEREIYKELISSY